MKLLTKKILSSLPALYTQEEKGFAAIAQVKFFTPWTNWTWYATEFDGKDLFFGWVEGNFSEWGYFTLSELQSIRGPWGLVIERDLFFEPTKIEDLINKQEVF